LGGEESGLNGFFARYRRAGGFGLVITHDGERLASFDVHPWLMKGSRTTRRMPAPFWKWPHIDMPPLNVKHWPWQK